MNDLILEFGVMDGMSLRQLCKRFPDKTIYGFDSFSGIREKWNGHSAGDFACKIPKRLPLNAKLIIGWIEDTLPLFLKDHPENIAFVHIDTDTYSCASFILETIKDRLIPGSVILFDEYWNYPGYEKYEYKAWQEFLVKYPNIQVFQASECIKMIRRRFRDYPIGRLLHPIRIIQSLSQRVYGRLSNRKPMQMAFRIAWINSKGVI